MKEIPVIKSTSGVPLLLTGLLIFLVGFLPRLVYIWQLSHTYFFAPFKGGYDDFIFDNWALEILKGNWVGDKAIYIYRMPLYVYFLSFVYFLFGHNYWIVYMLHACLAGATCVLIYFISKIFFNNITGIVAALLYALYGTSFFYTGLLVGETLCIFTSCAAFLCLGLFCKAQKRYHILSAGILLGLSILLRGNMLVAVPFILLWIALTFKNGSKVFNYMLLFGIGIFAALSPIIIRNYVNEKDFVPINASGGISFYIGNSYGADGKYRLVDGVSNNPEEMLKSSIAIAQGEAKGRLKPSQVSDYWFKKTLRSIQEAGILFIIPLMIKKFVLFWNAYELPDIWDYYFFKQYIPILRFPFPAFCVIAALAAAGMSLGWKRRTDLSLLYLFITGYMFSLLAVFVNSRYRIVIAPFLSIFAAYAVIEGKAIFGKNNRRLITAAVIFMLFFIFSNISVDKAPFHTSHNSLGILLKRDGKINEAIAEYKKAIEIDPGYTTPYYNLGILYRDIGEIDRAVFYLKRAVEIDPSFTLARQKLKELFALQPP